MEGIEWDCRMAEVMQGQKHPRPLPHARAILSGAPAPTDSAQAELDQLAEGPSNPRQNLWPTGSIARIATGEPVFRHEMQGALRAYVEVARRDGKLLPSSRAVASGGCPNWKASSYPARTKKRNHVDNWTLPLR